ncbi:hypothetical protein QAD02_019551, partial [Eretmocerus hayati]
GQPSGHWNGLQNSAEIPLVNYPQYAESIFQGNGQCNEEVSTIEKIPPTRDDGISEQRDPFIDIDAAGPSWATPPAPYDYRIPNGDDNRQVIPSHVYDMTSDHESSDSGPAETPKASRIFSCTLCPKKLASKKSLRTHMLLHTGNYRYTCEICGKGFAFSLTLENHRRTHTGERPFTCDICDKNFIQKGHLQRHKKVHTGGKLFACFLCEQKFKYKNNRKRHMDLHMERWPTMPEPYARILNRGCTWNLDMANHMIVHGSSSCSRTNHGRLAHRQADDFQSGSQERHQYQQQPAGCSGNVGMVTTGLNHLDVSGILTRIMLEGDEVFQCDEQTRAKITNIVDEINTSYYEKYGH